LHALTHRWTSLTDCTTSCMDGHTLHGMRELLVEPVVIVTQLSHLPHSLLSHHLCSTLRNLCLTFRHTVTHDMHSGNARQLHIGTSVHRDGCVAIWVTISEVEEHMRTQQLSLCTLTRSATRRIDSDSAVRHSYLWTTCTCGTMASSHEH